MTRDFKPGDIVNVIDVNLDFNNPWLREVEVTGFREKDGYVIVKGHEGALHPASIILVRRGEPQITDPMLVLQSYFLQVAGLKTNAVPKLVLNSVAQLSAELRRLHYELGQRVLPPAPKGSPDNPFVIGDIIQWNRFYDSSDIGVGLVVGAEMDDEEYQRLTVFVSEYEYTEIMGYSADAATPENTAAFAKEMWRIEQSSRESRLKVSEQMKELREDRDHAIKHEQDALCQINDEWIRMRNTLGLDGKWLNVSYEDDVDAIIALVKKLKNERDQAVAARDNNAEAVKALAARLDFTEKALTAAETIQYVAFEDKPAPEAAPAPSPAVDEPPKNPKTKSDWKRGEFQSALFKAMDAFFADDEDRSYQWHMDDLSLKCNDEEWLIVEETMNLLRDPDYITGDAPVETPVSINRWEYEH